MRKKSFGHVESSFHFLGNFLGTGCAIRKFGLTSVQSFRAMAIRDFPH